MARAKSGETSKADVIRKGLADHPEMGPSELAVVLNELVKKDKLGFAEIKPGEISVYRSKAKQAAEPPAAQGPPARKAPSARTTTQPGQVSVAEVIQTARELVDRLGKEEAKKVIDLL
jgi:hypothetical protein